MLRSGVAKQAATHGCAVAVIIDASDAYLLLCSPLIILVQPGACTSCS